MHIPFYQVDAFSDKPFHGNPAAVCPLPAWLPDEQMQAMAGEHNLAETAFLIPHQQGFAIRWFTPTVEVDLCGHATMAAAHVAFHELGFSEAVLPLFSPRSGALSVSRKGEKLFLDFPADNDITSLPSLAGLEESLGTKPLEIYRARTDVLVRLETEADVINLAPDLHQLKNIEARGVIVTAPGSKSDFSSRFFAPQAGVPEDPVTGSAHTTLIPYWAKKLGKTELFARQLSAREGELWCKDLGERVEIGGHTCMYSKGEISL
ncbi:MAG: PhzF family phenazine biosynthesis protein [Bacteroidia bacterium]